MTQEQEAEVLRLIKDVDITEVMALLMKHGTRYNRRILKFFKYFCMYAPILIMLTHACGVVLFSLHPREMFVTFHGNEACYLFIYTMVYLLPMVIILASRFFWLCWRYRIPFFYYFGVNAIHLGNHSIFTTNSMINNHFCLFIMVGIIYLYSFSDLFINNTRLGRRICA